MKEKQFVWFQEDPPRFVNLEHIMMATLEESGLVLTLAGGVTINITGPVKEDLYMLLMSHSVMANGEPPTESIRRLKNKIAAAASSKSES